MKPFKFLYMMATFMWGVFSIASMAFLFGELSFERFALVGFLLTATLIEEIYYLIEERVIRQHH